MKFKFFKTPKGCVKMDDSVSPLSTPLGTVESNLFRINENEKLGSKELIQPTAQYKTHTGAMRVYDQEDFYLECWETPYALIPFISGKDITTHIYLWRLEAKQECANLQFRTQFTPAHSEVTGGYNGGQYCTAIEFKDQNFRVNMATNDAAAWKGYAAEGKWMPKRFEQIMAAYAPHYEDFMTTTEDEILVPVPTLYAGEQLQTHCVVAWVSQDDPDTWAADYATDIEYYIATNVDNIHEFVEKGS